MLNASHHITSHFTVSILGAKFMFSLLFFGFWSVAFVDLQPFLCVFCSWRSSFVFFSSYFVLFRPILSYFVFFSSSIIVFASFFFFFSCLVFNRSSSFHLCENERAGKLQEKYLEARLVPLPHGCLSVLLSFFPSRRRDVRPMALRLQHFKARKVLFYDLSSFPWCWTLFPLSSFLPFLPSFLPFLSSFLLFLSFLPEAAAIRVHEEVARCPRACTRKGG